MIPPAPDAIALACAPLAYLGPGGALSAIGSFLALLAAVLLAFVGFVWYPIQRLRRALRERRRRREDAAAAPKPAPTPDDERVTA